MTSKEIIKEVMSEENITLALLAEKLGFSHASGVSERLRNKKSMNVDTFVKFLEAMDCEVVVRSKKKGRKDIKVTLEDEEKEEN